MRVSQLLGRLLLVACTSVVLSVIGCGGGGESAFDPNAADGSADGDITGEEDGGGGVIIGNGPGCEPKTCQALGLECGPQGDGCGGILQCGDCPQGTFCGGGGASKCGIGVAPDGG